jgi:2-iminobutanoate/2-iminopropanoate deaminase
MKKEIRTSNAPSPAGPYSQGILFDERLVFVSGQTSYDPKSGVLVGENISEQTNQIFNNIEAILYEISCDLSDVLKVSVFLSDFGDFGLMNEVYSSRFQTPYPARTTVEAGLAEGTLVEIDVIAARNLNNQDK